MRKEGKRKALAALVCGSMLTVALVGGTLAYLTDTDSDVNVMTVGNVSIEQHEYQEAENGSWEPFEQGKGLYPGTDISKIVTVENTGKSDVYFRTLIAFEDAVDSETFEVNFPIAEFGDYEWSWGAPEATIVIDGVTYKVYEAVYKKALPAGETSSPSLTKVVLDEDATNEDMELLGDTYEILVLSQAVQTAGFADAKTALDTAFPGINDPEVVAGWFSGDEFEIPTAVKDAAELSSALSAGKSVYLTDNVVVSSTMNVAAGSDVKLNLNGHDLSYAVDNDKAAAIIDNKGSLEITGQGTISFTAANPDMQEIPAYATNTITNTGKLVIGEGVIVTNGSEGGASYAVDNHGEFILDGGTLRGDRCALRVAKYNQDNVRFVMNSGTVEAQTPAWIQLPGSTATAAPSITVIINGGKFVSTKATSDENNVLYTYSSGNSHANTSITINGGEFLGGTVSIGSGYKGDAPELAINGGTFEYDVVQWLANNGSKVLYKANK